LANGEENNDVRHEESESESSGCDVCSNEQPGENESESNERDDCSGGLESNRGEREERERGEESDHDGRWVEAGSETGFCCDIVYYDMGIGSDSSNVCGQATAKDYV
jgi:hypothetical protein